MKKIMKKIKLFISSACFSLIMYQVAFADVASISTDAIRNGMRIVAVIPAAIGIYSFINAGIAFSQNQQEGGNAQASAKMSNNIVGGIAALTLAVLIGSVFTDMVLNLMSAA